MILKLHVKKHSFFSESCREIKVFLFLDHVTCDAEDMFQCASSDECIYGFHKCNGKEDCDDGSDEEQAQCEPESRECDGDSSLLRCHNSTQCYRPDQACDGNADCDDKTDEIGCHVSLIFCLGKI